MRSIHGQDEKYKYAMAKLPKEMSKIKQCLMRILIALKTIMKRYNKLPKQLKLTVLLLVTEQIKYSNQTAL